MLLLVGALSKKKNAKRTPLVVCYTLPIYVSTWMHTYAPTCVHPVSKFSIRFNIVVRQRGALLVREIASLLYAASGIARNFVRNPTACQLARARSQILDCFTEKFSERRVSSFPEKRGSFLR
jgi:hypothetical protein